MNSSTSQPANYITAQEYIESLKYIHYSKDPSKFPTIGQTDGRLSPDFIKDLSAAQIIYGYISRLTPAANGLDYYSDAYAALLVVQGQQGLEVYCANSVDGLDQATAINLLSQLFQQHCSEFYHSVFNHGYHSYNSRDAYNVDVFFSKSPELTTDGNQGIYMIYEDEDWMSLDYRGQTVDISDNKRGGATPNYFWPLYAWHELIDDVRTAHSRQRPEQIDSYIKLVEPVFWRNDLDKSNYNLRHQTDYEVRNGDQSDNMTILDSAVRLALARGYLNREVFHQFSTGYYCNNHCIPIDQEAIYDLIKVGILTNGRKVKNRYGSYDLRCRPLVKDYQKCLDIINTKLLHTNPAKTYTINTDSKS